MLQNATKKKEVYGCSICKYSTERKSSYNKHKLTAKHENATKKSCEKLQPIGEGNQLQISQPPPTPGEGVSHNATKVAKSCKKLQNKSVNNYECKSCGKQYSHRTSLHRHVKMCPHIENVRLIKNKDDDFNNLLQIVKSNQELQTQMMGVFKEISHTNITNNINHQEISINVFLNEHCKAAMNLTDFVHKIKLNSKDLNALTELGHVQGYANIFLNALKNIPCIERPIHCCDTKKLEFYVKDDDNWGKDNGQKMEKAIENISIKNIKKLKEWEQENPDYETNPTTNELWNNIIKNIIGNPLQQNKKNIIKQISATIDINEAIKHLKI